MNLKRTKIIKILACALGFIIVELFIGCSFIKYGNQVKQDTFKNFTSHKEFIVNTEFEGLIINKSKCEHCKINKFVLLIEITSIKKEPTFGERNYQPYYEFKNDSILEITVLDSIFNTVKVGVKIQKNHGYNIVIAEQSYKLLSTESHKWFHDQK